MKILDIKNIEEIATAFKEGEVIVFPTETSYGMGCDARNQKAVDKIFDIKKRVTSKPLLVVVSSIKKAKKYLAWNNSLESLSDKWPGALTVINEYVPPPFKEGDRGRSRLLGYVKTISLRKKMRKEPTKSEKLLWSKLRSKLLGGLKIRRQHGIGPYVVDFYEPTSQTVIELDGDIHFSDKKQENKDKRREEYFKKHGYKILRFNNVDVFRDVNAVLDHIYFNCTDPSLTLPLKGEGTLASGVVSKDNTLALRVTANKFLQNILEKVDFPIVATSANIAGGGDIYSFERILEIYKNKKIQPDVIVDGGELKTKKPSTLVSVVDEEVKILRQGEVNL